MSCLGEMYAKLTLHVGPIEYSKINEIKHSKFSLPLFDKYESDPSCRHVGVDAKRAMMSTLILFAPNNVFYFLFQSFVSHYLYGTDWL